MKKRALSMLLAVVMVFSCLPLTVFAVQDEEDTSVADEAPFVVAEVDEPAAEAEEFAVEAVSGEIASLATEGSTLAEENILTEENFPDKQLLDALDSCFEGYLTAGTASKTTVLSLSGREINNLTGLNTWFPYLQELYCDNNNLLALDTNGLSYLTTLVCSGNPELSELKLTGMSKLKVLDCSNCKLPALNLTSCTNLAELYCNDNQLTALSVAANRFLTILNCEGNHLLSLNLSTNYKLSSFLGDKQSEDTLYVPAVALGDTYVANLNESNLPEKVPGANYPYADLLDAGGKYLAFCNESLELSIPTGRDGFALTTCVDVDVVGRPEYFGENYYLMEAGDSWGEEDFPASRPDSYPNWIKLSVFFENAAPEYAQIDDADFAAEVTCVDAYTDCYGEVRIEAQKACSGRVWLYWYIPDLGDSSPAETASFRLDVYDNENPITGVSLSEANKTVELFKDEYASFDILLEMDQLVSVQGTSVYIETDVPESAAYCHWTLNSAEFSEKELNDLFELVLAGDRTVKIVPTEAAVCAALNDKTSVRGSYTSTLEIELNYNGSTVSYTTTPMTITVKQTLPTLTAKNVSLNSYLGHAATVVNCTGSIPVPDGICSIVSDAPKGLAAIIDETGKLYVSYDGEAMVKTSSMLSLECQVSGWRVTAPLNLKVSIAPITPKLSLSKSSVTVTAGMSTAERIGYKLTAAMEAAYPGYVPEVANIVGVKCDVPDGLSVSFDENQKQIVISAEGVASDFSGTCSVTLRYIDKDFTLKVIVKAYVTPKLTIRASGHINIGALSTVGTSTPITIRPTISGTAKYQGVYPGTFTFSVMQKVVVSGNLVLSNRSLNGSFKLSSMDDSGNLYLEYVGGGSAPLLLAQDNPGYRITHTLKLYYSYQYQGKKITVESGTKTIRIKRTSMKPGVSIKQRGSIDPLHIYAENSAITLTTSYKNLPYGGAVSQEPIFFKKVGGTWVELGENESPFYYSCEVAGVAGYSSEEFDPTHTKYYGNVTLLYTIRSLYPEVMNGTYGVRLRVYSTDGVLCESPLTKLSIKADTVQLRTDKSEVTLLLKDRFDTAIVSAWSAKEGFSGCSIDLDAASAQWFRLEQISESEYAIGWANNTLPTGWKDGTTKTITLNVFMNGNTSGKPNAKVKLKVKAVSQGAVTEYA